MSKLYTKNTWNDEVLSGAERYNILEDGGGAYKSNMQINLATGITTAGSPVNAARMNNLEVGLDAVDTKLADTTDLFTTGGTSTAYTVTTTGAAALATGEIFRVKFHTTAGATPTLNRDGKGAKNLKYFDSTGTKQSCASTNIVSNLISLIVYDGTDYIVANPVGVASLPDDTAFGSGWNGDTTHGPSRNAVYDKIVSLPGANGWIPDTNTWSYSSADSPSFVISINADMTAILQAGMRIKLTQTTAKYFIVTAVGAFSAGATLVTVYGGTDYTLANASITSPYYSQAKAPFGFPLDPTKWTVQISDTTGRTQATATQNTWYNLGTTNEQITIPIGIWDVYMQIAPYSVKNPATSINAFATMSTANNTESDADMTVYASMSAPSGSLVVAGVQHRRKTFVLASKTLYYLNAKTSTSGGVDTLGFDNASSKMIVRAVCAYL